MRTSDAIVRLCVVIMLVLGSSGLTLAQETETSAASGGGTSAAQRPPNIVVIFADDMGYGDLACYGAPTTKTPNLDRMAREGLKLTQFYVPSPACTPSRAALLTGRQPIRSGMIRGHTGRGVLFPDSAGGLPTDEITLAEALKKQGYATQAVGKWHLGCLPKYLPTNNGFDHWFGIPYSNDMDPTHPGISQRRASFEGKVEYFNVPLMRDEKIVERPANQNTITKRYTQEAVKFINANRDQPFFLYLAHSMPHVPLFRSSKFEGVSRRGIYGDVIAEIDWSVGRVLDTLRKQGLAENTLVIFTSDNGPWTIYNRHGGSPGPFNRGAKGTTWDGGVHEPAIAWWPGRIPAGKVTNALGSTMDILPTAVKLAGGTVPTDRTIDGKDLLPVLLGKDVKVHDHLFFYLGQDLSAVRQGPYKLHLYTHGGGLPPGPKNPALLFNVEEDPGETIELQGREPDVAARMLKLAKGFEDSFKPPRSQLIDRVH